MRRAETEQSDCSFWLDLTSLLFDDIQHLSGLNLRRDFETIVDRFNHEGPPFLTKTLPSFMKHILRCVDEGSYRPDDNVYFRHSRQGRPLFLAGLINEVFDENGGLHPEPSVEAMKYLHQLGAFFKKTEVPYTERQTSLKLEGYKSLEANYPDLNPAALSDFGCKVLDNAAELLKEVFGEEDLHDIIPRHGPGSVANKEKNGEKYVFFRDNQLHHEYRFADYFQTSGTYLPDPLSWDVIQHHYDTASRVLLDPITTCGPSRVCLVQKDSGGPRIIESQPKEYQWVQQGQGRRMMKLIESHPLTRGHVNFKDQGVNKSLALRGSRGGRWATIDWTDASDRIGFLLVKRLFPFAMARALSASRVSHVELPDGQIIKIKKFAGMGSATCFPVESLVFWAISVGTISALTGRDFRSCTRFVFVYGDDVIVRSEYAEEIMKVGIELGMKPSSGKCFIHERPFTFRESCGMDAFGGEDITPVRLRCTPPSKRDDVSKMLSWVATSNLLHFAGYWRTANYMAQVVESVVGALPTVPQESGQFGVHSFLQGYHLPNFPFGRPRKVIWNVDLQHQEYFGLGFEPITEIDPANLTEFLLRSLARDSVFDAVPPTEVRKQFFQELPTSDDQVTDIRPLRDAYKRRRKPKPLIWRK